MSARWQESDLESLRMRQDARRGARGRPKGVRDSKPRKPRKTKRQGYGAYFTGLALTPEYRFAPPRRWRFDLAHCEKKVAVEIEGGIWIYGRHNRPSGFYNDLQKYNQAALMGWRVFRFTPQQVKTGQAKNLVEQALNAV